MTRVSVSELKANLSPGVIRPGTGDARNILERPPLEIPGRLSSALDEEREDRF